MRGDRQYRSRLLLTPYTSSYSIGQKLEIIGRASSRLVGLDTLFYCVNLKGEDRREEFLKCET